jgi:hypothetical protein
MNLLKQTLLCAISGSILLGNASAATFRDSDLFLANGVYLSSGNSLNGTFELDTDDGDLIPDQTGFIPGTHFAVSATIEFLLSDDGVGGFGADLIDFNGNWDEGVTIDLGTFNLATDFEINILTVVGTTTANLTLLGDINDEGRLNYTLKAADGDFLAIGGRVTVEAETTNSQVPDGGSSLGLLTLALAGLRVLRRE